MAYPSRPILPAGPGRSPLVAEDHRLPAHRDKLERITDHLTGLSEEGKAFVDYRIKLLKAQVEEKIEGRVSALKGLAIVGGIAAIAALFGLVTLALWIGVWLGRPAWGFLVVTGLLVVGVFVAKAKFVPGKIRIEHSETTGKLKVVQEQTPAEAKMAEGKAPDLSPKSVTVSPAAGS